MSKLFLVDGSNLLFQMFFGMPARISGPDGRPIQGTVGFVGALLKMLRWVRPSHVLVVFDGEDSNPRAAIDADYKANRPDWSAVPAEENPYSQLADICAALDAMGIPRFETTICEADDLIAAYALSAPCKTVISSLDSDLFQLVGDNVRLLRYRGDKSAVCGPEEVFARFGVMPDRYAQFKALVGDPSDNIRGANKVGPKTAAALLAQFGSLDALLSNIDAVQKPSVRASLAESAPRLRRNLKLIELGCTAPLPIPFEDLAVALRDTTSAEVLRAIGLR